MVDLRRFVLFLLYYDKHYYYVGDKHCPRRSLYTSLLRYCVAAIHYERKTLAQEGVKGRSKEPILGEK